MISKRIPIRSAARGSFKKLVGYITSHQGKLERVGAVRCTNCHSTSPEWAVNEVQATQQQNTRATGDRTYHLVISFAPGEVPPPEVLAKVEDRLCAAMGYADHQRISAVHMDTGALHLHVAINKIHPERLTMHEPYRDYRVRSQTCAALEAEFALQRVDHRARKTLEMSQAADTKARCGRETLVAWIGHACLDALHSAVSWQEWHATLGANGLTMQPRGNGLVIANVEGVVVKASSVAREFSRQRLEQRFGPYQHGQQGESGKCPEPAIHHGDEPAGDAIHRRALHERYMTAQQALSMSRALALNDARRRCRQRIALAKSKGKLKRAVIRMLNCDRFTKKLLIAAANASLRREVEHIREAHHRNARDIAARWTRQTWTDWLRCQQDGSGAQRRTRTIAAGSSPSADAHRGNAMVRDRGTTLHVAAAASSADLAKALVIARKRYGPVLHAEGSAAFKERIVQLAAAAQMPISFDDTALEQRRRTLLSHVSSRKESDNEPVHVTRRGIDPGRNGGHGRSAADIGRATSVRQRAAVALAGGRGNLQPHAKRAGKKPPPEGRNRLRRLSELDVVRIDSRSEVLLPGDVRRYLEQPGTDTADRLRRRLPGIGNAGQIRPETDWNANHREKLEFHHSGISNKSNYNPAEPPVASCLGMQQAGGQHLALIRHHGTVITVPVGDADAARLRRLEKGEPVTVNKQGFIVTKGRTR